MLHPEVNPANQKLDNSPKPKSRRLPNPTHEELMEAIDDSFGIYQRVAKRLGIKRFGMHQIKRYLANDPIAKKAFEDEEKVVVDTCKRTVYQAVEDGNVKAAQWVLSKLHPDKFSDTVKVEGAQILKIEYVFPENDPEMKELIKNT